MELKVEHPFIDREDAEEAGEREKIERQQQELVRLQEVLQLQTTLDSLGADEVRADLLRHKSLVSCLSSSLYWQMDGH